MDTQIVDAECPTVDGGRISGLRAVADLAHAYGVEQEAVCTFQAGSVEGAVVADPHEVERGLADRLMHGIAVMR